MENDLQVYKPLAERLDALPNGYPPAADGAELRVLAKLFTPEEAELASQLNAEVESVEAIAARTGREAGLLRRQLKEMVRRGLIKAGRAEGGLGYGLLPFVVGIYEMQGESIDAELARLVEDYFVQAFGEALRVRPHFQRVVPVRESIAIDMEIHPYETAADLVDAAKAWGVIDCICRKQKALIGEACAHPLDVCMVLSDTPGAYDQNSTVRALSLKEAHATLTRAAQAGLVHSVSNNQEGVHYICNCCTCSCGILRGMANLGIANVVARSAFVNQVDEDLCNACENCLSYCQFDALKLDTVMQVDGVRCIGCGVCVAACPEEALVLVRRPEEEIFAVPHTSADWRAQRTSARGLAG